MYSVENFTHNSKLLHNQRCDGCDKYEVVHMKIQKYEGGCGGTECDQSLHLQEADQQRRFVGFHEKYFCER